jgi:hypothetical protein
LDHGKRRGMVGRSAHCGNSGGRLPICPRCWPYEGPIGVRERSDLHIIEEWRYLGTARNEKEIHQVLECRPAFDEATFTYLSKTLARLPRRRIVQLARDKDPDG